MRRGPNAGIRLYQWVLKYGWCWGWLHTIANGSLKDVIFWHSTPKTGGGERGGGKER